MHHRLRTGKPVPDGQSPVACASAAARPRSATGPTRLKSRETFQGEWCTSADVFRRDDDGYFYYEGRSDDLIKVSGIWTSPLEIENVLLAHPAVGEVCILGREDEEKLVKPMARSSCCAAGPRRAARSSRLELKDVDRRRAWRRTSTRVGSSGATALPKNDRGKVARKILKQELADWKPSGAGMTSMTRLGKRLTWPEARAALRRSPRSRSSRSARPSPTARTSRSTRTSRSPTAQSDRTAERAQLEAAVRYGPSSFPRSPTASPASRRASRDAHHASAGHALGHAGGRGRVARESRASGASCFVERRTSSPSTSRSCAASRGTIPRSTPHRAAGHLPRQHPSTLGGDTLGDEFKSGDCHAGTLRVQHHPRRATATRVRRGRAVEALPPVEIQLDREECAQAPRPASRRCRRGPRPIVATPRPPRAEEGRDT